MPVLQSVASAKNQLEGRYTLKEVSEHSDRSSCWVIIDGMVYDLTEWLPKHPGGEIVILGVAGSDCTDVYRAYHSPSFRDRMLKPHRIGEVSGYSISPAVADFRRLVDSIEGSSLMDTRFIFYIKLVVWYLTLLLGSILAVTAFPNDFWVSTVLGGVLMGAYFQQIAFWGHDLGHSSVTQDRSTDMLLGILCGNALSGISMGWWKATHNTHHVATNYMSSDPDIQHLPFFAIDLGFMKSIYSLYHERLLKFTQSAKLLVPHQAKLYYLVMAVARCNLYVQSYLFLFSGTDPVRRRIKTNRWIELAGLLVFAGWFSFLMAAIPHPTWRLLFFAISHSLAGILHVQITLSHFAMPVYHDTRSFGGVSFLEHQLGTSMDIDCYPWLDWFHGGLNFQTAHHLFPRVPRHNLRKVREIMMAFCAKHSLKYTCVDFLAANKLVLSHLDTIGMAAKLAILHDIANLRG